MKIKTNNIDLFKRLEDLIPNLSIDISDILNNKYVVDSNLNYVLSDGKKLGTYITNAQNLLTLLNNISNNRTQEIYIDYYSKSSKKTLSNLVRLMFLTYGTQKIDDYYTLSNFGIMNIINVIYARYYKKWQKLYNTTLLNYDAIKPYDVTISETTKDELTSKDKLTKGTINTVHTVDGTIESNNEKDFKVAYNSNDSSLTDEIAQTHNSNSTGDVTNNTNSTNEDNYDRTNDITKSVSRKGNNGNITIQELINKEREILEYQIFDTIFNDLDRVLTRSKYI